MKPRPRASRPADNPFASRRIEKLGFRFRGDDIDEILALLAGQDHRGAIVGPHGSGKTTLLEKLADHLSGKIVWVRLNAGSRNPKRSARGILPHAVDRHHAILIDGAEQLGRWSWWRLHREIHKAGIIVITSHLPGRFPTIHECTTSPELLRELMGELAPETAATVDLEDLYERQGGNIRLCFRELYDVWAGRSPGSAARSRT